MRADSGISERGRLEKRAGRIFTSAKVGSYGISFSNFQPALDFCPNHIFSWHASKYPSTRNTVNQVPANGGEENTNDGADDPNAVTLTSAPDIIGIGRFGNGPFIDVQYLYSTNSPSDNDGFHADICDSVIAGFPNRFASTDDLEYRTATGKDAEMNYYDSELLKNEYFYFLLTGGKTLEF